MKAFAAVVIVAVSVATLRAAPPSGTLRGYTLVGSARERLVEEQFIDIPSAQSALDTASAIGARPHYAGTPADYALAVYMRDRMRADGLSADLEPLKVPVDTPRELVLELAPRADLTAPAGRAKRRDRHAAFPIALDLAEAAEPSDSATAAHRIGLPFNAGSGDGDVSAPLVYAGRGLNPDYDLLAQARVDVRGAVVLVRYGAQFRGLLAERAQARGVAGVIFYSDPQDDGAARGLVYPRGPWRPLAAIERGSVGTAIHIPTLPISAANAQILLGSLQGTPGPSTWAGALPIAYPLARGPGRVHLIVKLNRKPTTLWNTIGLVPGIHDDQSILLGAQRDAWVYGVGANGAGVTTMLEVARGLGFLLQGGWRPQRTIVIAGWDGEELGFAGSRAYAFRHRVDLTRGCYAYLNGDQSVTGSAFAAVAVAAIAPVIVDATHGVRDPSVPGATIYDRWAAQRPRNAPSTDATAGTSDHESFAAEAGTPIAAMRFSGPFGVNGSSYDTLNYATRVSDPGFDLHRAAAQLYGVVALRLADADRVPYTFAGYAALVRNRVSQLAARARHDGRPFDATAFRRAIDRFASVAGGFDTALVGTNRAEPTGELRAARRLDSLLYGTAGYASLMLPDIDAAVTSHQPAEIGAAIGRAADSLNRATNELGS